MSRQHTPPKDLPNASRRLIRAAAVVIGITVVGGWGYHFIEGWSWADSFYMVFITMSTVGFGEVQPLDTAGRIWTIALVLGGVGAVGYTAATLVEFLIEGYFSGYRRRRLMDRLISNMRNHTILCGYGRVGRQIAADLAASGVDLVIIDQEDLADGLSGSSQPHVIGNAEHEATLRAAGIERAAALISAVDSDTENVFITLSARVLNPELRIIARASDTDAIRKLKLVGAERVVSPYTTSGRRMAHLALHPAATDVFEVLAGPLQELSVEVQQMEIRGDGGLSGRSIAELDLRRQSGALVVALREGDQAALNPDPSKVLNPGSVLTLMGTADQCRKLHELNESGRSR